MSSIDHTLDMAANIKGAFAVAIVDYDSGMTLGSRGGSPEAVIRFTLTSHARADGHDGPSSRAVSF